MADLQLVAYFKEFCTVPELKGVWKAAGQALLERKLEVVLTSTTFADGSASGEVRGDPGEVMGAARQAIDELNAEAGSEVHGGIGNPSINFSRRQVRT